MKDVNELYIYCSEKNLHTKSWIASRKQEAMICLKDEVWRCNGAYYTARRIDYDYVSNLWLIIENQCKEKAYLEDVHIVVNWIFQDIADQLEETLLDGIPYSVVLCAKLRGEAVLWMGPSQCAERFRQVYLESGYDAALASL